MSLKPIKNKENVGKSLQHQKISKRNRKIKKIPGKFVRIWQNGKKVLKIQKMLKTFVILWKIIIWIIILLLIYYIIHYIYYIIYYKWKNSEKSFNVKKLEISKKKQLKVKKCQKSR